MIRYPDNVSSNPNLAYAPPLAQLPLGHRVPNSSNIYLPALSQHHVPLSVYSTASPSPINNYYSTGGPLQQEHTSLSAPANYATSSTASHPSSQSLPHMWCPLSSSSLGQPFAPPIHQEVTYFPGSLPTRPLVLHKNPRNMRDAPTILPSLHRAEVDLIPLLEYTSPHQQTVIPMLIDPNDPDNIVSCCSRCKKEFVQDNISTSTSSGKRKTFKLCMHCRALQRERSRRWQNKTKGIQGACRRCGAKIPQGPDTRFVLCSVCRHRLRIHKKARCQRSGCDKTSVLTLPSSTHAASPPGSF